MSLAPISIKNLVFFLLNSVCTTKIFSTLHEFFFFSEFNISEDIVWWEVNRRDSWYNLM